MQIELGTMKKARAVVVGTALVGALGLGMAEARAAEGDVTPCESITQVTVTPDSGWDFSQTRLKGHYEFLEDGGLHVYTDPAAGESPDQRKVAGYVGVTIPLADFGLDNDLDYTNDGGVAPGMQIFLDRTGNGVTSDDGYLVGEFDVYGDGNWWSNKDMGVGAGLGYNSFGTLDDYLDANPAAVARAIGFSLGSGVDGDGVINSLSLGCTEYTFAAFIDADGDGIADTPAPTAASQCKSNGWRAFNNPTFRNQGQCVSYVQANANAGK